jgi:hypothetical protein
VQIRRSGRNNAEELNVNGTISKLAEFDFEGWHADPYIAENFMVFGKF